MSIDTLYYMQQFHLFDYLFLVCYNESGDIMKKSMIPNLLTFIRICLVPIIIILSIFKLYTPVIILAIIGALTDFLDGKLARYWHVTSLKGAKLDDVADKTFGIGLLLALIFKFKSLIIVLFLEIMIGGLNYYYHKKTNNTETLLVGKFKTAFIFITIILYFISITTGNVTFLNRGFRGVTINLQIICLIEYYLRYYKITHKITVDEIEEHKKIMNDETMVVESIEDLYSYMKKDS